MQVLAHLLVAVCFVFSTTWASNIIESTPGTAALAGDAAAGGVAPVMHRKDMPFLQLNLDTYEDRLAAAMEMRMIRRGRTAVERIRHVHEKRAHKVTAKSTMA